MSELSLEGLVQVASQILSGIFEPISSVFTSGEQTDWAVYDTVS
jgi:hypothetical protein